MGNEKNLNHIQKVTKNVNSSVIPKTFAFYIFFFFCPCPCSCLWLGLCLPLSVSLSQSMSLSLSLSFSRLLFRSPDGVSFCVFYFNFINLLFALTFSAVDTSFFLSLLLFLFNVHLWVFLFYLLYSFRTCVIRLVFICFS